MFFLLFPLLIWDGVIIGIPKPTASFFIFFLFLSNKIKMRKLGKIELEMKRPDAAKFLPRMVQDSRQMALISLLLLSLQFYSSIKDKINIIYSFTNSLILILYSLVCCAYLVFIYWGWFWDWVAPILISSELNTDLNHSFYV